MNVTPVLAWLLAFTLTSFAQPTSPRIPLVGTVESISGDTVHVKLRTEVVTLYADGGIAVWKGKKFHDFSSLKAGDSISVDAKKDSRGRLIAVSVWANALNFCAVITAINGDVFAVLTNFDADTYSGYRKENKLVLVNADTVFESGSKDELKPGRVVSVVGLDLKNGEVQATRIGIISGRTVQHRDGKVLPLAGPQK
jgi:hypothetical protein